MPPPQRPAAVDVERNVRSPMRDGCLLAADIYRPAHADHALPALVLRHPYDRRVSGEELYAPAPWYARQGFIVVVQDTRGRWGSEGRFVPFAYEGTDGYDTVEWAARLPGCSGRVGMYGASYAGYLQLLAAAERPPSLRAICPALAGADLYRDWFYEGGALSLAFASWWACTLGLDMARRDRDHRLEAALLRALNDPWRWYGSAPPAELPPIADAVHFYREWLDHPQRDAYWIQRSVEELHARIEVPALHIGGWYDSFNGGTVRNFCALRRLGRPDQRLFVGPWAHSGLGQERVGTVHFGAAGAGPIVDRTQAAFLREHLGPDGEAAEPPPSEAAVDPAASAARVRYFVLGAGAWAAADRWPPSGARTLTLYLRSGGAANTAFGDGRLDGQPPPAVEPWDAYVYEPEEPVPSIGGHSCCHDGAAPLGAADPGPVQQRKDVLVYTSAPLPDDLWLAGPVAVRLWVATDAPDADYAARLSLVQDGAAYNLAEGIERATGALRAPRGAAPVAVEVSLREVAARARKGQRLRLDVSGGSFPAWDVNPQSGAAAAFAQPAERIPATHVVHHDAGAPSHLSLTVVAAPGAQPPPPAGAQSPGPAPASRRPA